MEGDKDQFEKPHQRAESSIFDRQKDLGSSASFMRRSMDKKVKIKVGSFKSKLFSKSPVDETMKQDLRKRRLPTDMPTTLRTTSRGALGSVSSVAF